MDNYIKTIINGLKAWVENCVTVLEEKLPGAVEKRLGTKAEKNNPVFTGTFSMNRESNSKIGVYSHAEGAGCKASGNYSHAEGAGCNASGDYSHAEGNYSTASGFISHAEGAECNASGGCSHAEGAGCNASGDYSHAEGNYSTASGFISHAEGAGCNASGDYSHAEGNYTTANGDYSHAQGRYNIEDTEGKYAHIVGNGDHNKRSNAHTLDWNGVPWYQGRPQFGGNAQDDGSQAVMANGDTEITLKSPAGKLYKITVSDDGTLTTTEATT